MTDVSGIPLSPALIRGYLLELMEPGQPYKREDLQVNVTRKHEEGGGIPPNVLNPVDQFKKALSTLKQNGQLESLQGGYWRLADGAPVERLPIEPELESEAEENAEVVIGDGPETIYGWYFPRDRRLAEFEGTDRFPIKVGRTVRDAQRRLQESTGDMVPELPILGFVARVNNSGAWERLIHATLILRGQKVEGAIGNEWFRTSPDELQTIVEQQRALIDQDGQ